MIALLSGHRHAAQAHAAQAHPPRRRRGRRRRERAISRSNTRQEFLSSSPRQACEIFRMRRAPVVRCAGTTAG